MTLEDLSKLPGINRDKKRIQYHEIARVVFKDAKSRIEGNQVMYVEGLHLGNAGKVFDTTPALIGFSRIIKYNNLLGKMACQKDSISIPIDIITEYIPFKEKMENVSKKTKIRGQRVK